MQVIPAFAAVARGSIARLQEFHLQQLAILVGIIKQHVRNYVPTIFDLIEDLWDTVALQLPLVSLIEALGKALEAEFKPFLPSMLPRVLQVFDGDLNDKRTSTQIKVLDTFLTFGSNIEEYLYLVIPSIVKSYERADASTALRKRAMQVTPLNQFTSSMIPDMLANRQSMGSPKGTAVTNKQLSCSY